MVGGAFGPGFVAFEVRMEALFCVEERYISLKSIGSFAEGWNGLWMVGLQWEGKLLTLHGRMG